ncbi:MAG: hypothetical protein OXS47_00180 [Chloroflexota bacterium]|nr:hypothetical protein [Chloroflexota bacterium]
MNNDTWIQLVVLLVAIVGVGVSLGIMFQNAARESRREMNRIQDRVTAVEGNLRDRIAWIEGMLGVSGMGLREESSYRWRQIGHRDPEQEE